MEELQSEPSRSRRMRKRLATRSGLAIVIGTVAAASAVTVGAATMQGHSLREGGSASFTVSGTDLGGDPSAIHGGGWIDVQSWSWGASNSTNIGSQSSGAGAGKVTFNPFSITRYVDKASPVLMLACASGKVFPTLTFQADSVPLEGANSPRENLQIRLTSATVKNCGASNSGQGAPVESLSFNFAKIEFKYTDSSGKAVRTGWDVKANKSF